MNRLLVVCLMSSVATGLGAATFAFLAGSGWLLALVTYSLVGSTTLVLTTFIVQPGEARAPKAKPEVEPKPSQEKAVYA